MHLLPLLLICCTELLSVCFQVNDAKQEHKVKIVIADDTISIRRVLNLYLTRLGYSVLEAENGQKAVELVKQHDTQLAILDIAMPVKNGLLALQEIRELDSVLPVIMVTANDSKENIRTALHNGAFGFISKPIKFDELERLVVDALRRREVAELKQKIADSARLIAVGEMSGQVAHEVLNPITAVMTRIEEMAHNLAPPEESGMVLIKEIIETWQKHYHDNTLDDYMRKPSGFTEGLTCAEEDFNDMLNIATEYIAQENTYRDNIAFLEKSILRVIKIVDNMRRLSRHQGNPVPISWNQVINESVELMMDTMRKRNIELKRNLDPHIPEVKADFDEMIQVMTNLLKNSIHAVGKVRHPGVIEFATCFNEDRIEVRITDNGVGVPEELQQVNFDKTFTTKDVSEGTGLGLGISRRLIRKYDGDIELEWSKTDEGTCFLIWMPPYSPEETNQTQ